MTTQALIDWSPVGFTNAVKRFLIHAVIVAAVAGVTDLASSVQNYHVSNESLVFAATIALVSSAIHNALIWLQTKQPVVPAPLVVTPPTEPIADAIV